MLNFLASTRTVAAIAFGMVFSFGAWPQDASVVAAVVTSVHDGDTIKVQLSAGPVLVRLANIDAPESIQSGGGAATRALHNRILGQPVSLKVVDRDRDELLVAVVFLGDENINAWMVKQGHAWAYRGFNQEADYCVWENAARSLRPMALSSCTTSRRAATVTIFATVPRASHRPPTWSSPASA